MVVYNALTNLYKVFGKTLTEKRAKRDGRNPATGAFSTGSHTGIVDLTVDIPMVKGTKNLDLPDKTKYRKGVNSPDLVSNDFRDKVIFVFSLDSETHSNSTCQVSDTYGNTVDFGYNTFYEGAYIFLFGDHRVIGSESYPGKIFIFALEKVFEFCTLRRNTNGDLLISGRIQGTEQHLYDVNLGTIFPEFTS